jgi:hypothetical protein
MTFSCVTYLLEVIWISKQVGGAHTGLSACVCVCMCMCVCVCVLLCMCVTYLLEVIWISKQVWHTVSVQCQYQYRIMSAQCQYSVKMVLA